MKKYNLDLVAATFIILDSNEASMQVSFAKRKSGGSEFLTECLCCRLPASGRSALGTQSTWSARCSAGRSRNQKQKNEN